MVTLEEFIPKNHLIRKLDKSIDLNNIHERVAHLYCPDKETVERILPLQNNYTVTVMQVTQQCLLSVTVQNLKKIALHLSKLIFIVFLAINMLKSK
ncbi:hypothetical protein DKC18_018865 (plasmid) [Acinetobacter nosocomialis]|nr:hypothetical protein DKC18_018865 [Acinetobacter nosocomialis]